MGTRAKYNDDSLARALELHRRNGIVERYNRPDVSHRKWLVWTSQGAFLPEEFTSAQVYAFCVGVTDTYRTVTGRSAWAEATS